jgi:DNA-binding NarL/FixJ family response regulator
MNPSIAVVDDHRIILDGLRRLIESTGEWSVRIFQNGADALAAWETMSFDLMVVDLRMPGMTGIELIRNLRQDGRKVPIVVLTAGLSDYELAEAMNLQVAGIVLKEDATSALVECIATVLGGGTYLKGSGVAEGLTRLERSAQSTGRAVSKLTSRELEIAKLAADGWRTKEIGAKLGISPGTVKIHLHAIYSKLEITTRVELANFVRDATTGNQ